MDVDASGVTVAASTVVCEGASFPAAADGPQLVEGNAAAESGNEENTEAGRAAFDAVEAEPSTEKEQEVANVPIATPPLQPLTTLVRRILTGYHEASMQ